MKTSFTLLLTLLLLFAHASQNRKVLIIGIDGARTDAFQQANTPHIDALLSNATYTYDSWHTGITWSGPSWSTILTGVNWNKHGVTDNSFNGKQFNQYPPLATLAKQIMPSLYSAIVAEWNPLIDDITNASWDRAVKVADGSNWPTADSAVIELQNPDLDLLFAYFDKVDLTGHTTTFSASNPTYISAIQDVDSAVGRVLNALYARPAYSSEDWLILLVTDHGGTSFFHGGNTEGERHIWWIASGNAVATQLITQSDPGTYNCNSNSVFDSTCVDITALRQTPVHADITVTALHHLIYESGVYPETKPEWNLDGKSWLANASTIAEFEAKAAFTMFPNPASGELIITRSDDVNGEWVVEMFSTEGRMVCLTRGRTQQQKVNTAFFERGIYFLKSGNTVRRVLLN